MTRFLPAIVQRGDPRGTHVECQPVAVTTEALAAITSGPDAFVWVLREATLRTSAPPYHTLHPIVVHAHELYLLMSSADPDGFPGPTAAADEAKRVMHRQPPPRTVCPRHRQSAEPCRSLRYAPDVHPWFVGTCDHVPRSMTFSLTGEVLEMQSDA